MEKDQAALLIEIASFLDKHAIPYMITGALSVVFYGRPRASHDIDFIVEIKKEEVKKVIEAFKSLPTVYSVQPETIEEAVEKKNMFNVIYLPSYLKLDFWLLTNEEFDQQRFKRRITVDLLDHKMTLTTPEDTIIQKLLWYKEAHIEKHLVDAAFVLKIQEDKLDKKYLENWIKKLKLTKLYKSLDKINLGLHI